MICGVVTVVKWCGVVSYGIIGGWDVAVLVFDFFFFKQKTAYEMRISDWSSDVCSSDLVVGHSSQCGSRSEGAKGIKSQDRGRSDVERAIKDSGCTVMDRLDGSSFSA